MHIVATREERRVSCTRTKRRVEFIVQRHWRRLSTPQWNEPMLLVFNPIRKRQQFMAGQPVLIAGKWRDANSSSTFRADNPATKEPLPDEYPVSTWADCDEALAAATTAAAELRAASPEKI